jgi:hypothetical protein
MRRVGRWPDYRSQGRAGHRITGLWGDYLPDVQDEPVSWVMGESNRRLLRPEAKYMPGLPALRHA